MTDQTTEPTRALSAISAPADLILAALQCVAPAAASPTGDRFRLAYVQVTYIGGPFHTLRFVATNRHRVHFVDIQGKEPHGDRWQRGVELPIKTAKGLIKDLKSAKAKGDMVWLEEMPGNLGRACLMGDVPPLSLFPFPDKDESPSFPSCEKILPEDGRLNLTGHSTAALTPQYMVDGCNAAKIADKASAFSNKGMEINMGTPGVLDPIVITTGAETSDIRFRAVIMPLDRYSDGFLKDQREAYKKAGGK